ncbi:MAG: OFA family MFS transporter [Elusimicrobiota bacterium]|nr:OFA family MFS transporter [Elusimicrobiota bacterium]
MEKKTDNPSLVVASGTLIMLMLGVAYVWGVYINPISENFDWTRTQASLPFSVFLLIYTVGMIWGGKLQDKYGPKIVCTIGVVLFSVGYFLSGFANSLLHILITYGVLGGIGTGFAYVTPVATAVKWYPHKKGLVSGIVVFGFGAGAFILSPLVRWLITNYGWRESFLYLGGVFFVITILAARMIKAPPLDWAQKFQAKQTTRPPLFELAPSQVLKSELFYIAWFIWFFNLFVGLGTMGHIVSYAMLNGIDKMTAAFLLSIIAIFNGFGRVAIGAFSDKIGRLRVLSAASIVLATVSFFMLKAGSNVSVYYVLCALFGLAFGSCMVLYPATAADLFGTKHFGTNYGLLFSSYGLAGLLGPYVFGKIYDLNNDYTSAFYLAICITVISGVLAVILRLIAKNKSKKS